MLRLRYFTSLRRSPNYAQINYLSTVRFSNDNMDPKNRFKNTNSYDEQERLMNPDEITENREKASKIVSVFFSNDLIIVQ